jgi:cytochrome c peroxidase
LAGAWSIYELKTVGTSVQRLLDDNYKSINAARLMTEALERKDSAILLLLSGNWTEGREIIESALRHNLRAERLNKPQMVNGRMASADGPIKTFPLRGIKDSPPYLHDGRLLTLEDTVDFNLIQGLKLTEQEKKDLVAFMRAL